MKAKSSAVVQVDYKRDEVPAWVREVIETSLAIEQEDARSAGSLGFMTRALVSATMPYKDPRSQIFERRNGDLTLTILSPSGVPFGKYPRLVVSYLVTEAVKTREPRIVLGDTLAAFLKTTVGVRATGGTQGTQTRLTDQMEKLFTSMVTVRQRVDTEANRGFQYKNITLIDKGYLSDEDKKRLDAIEATPAVDVGSDSVDEATPVADIAEDAQEAKLWHPLDKNEARWRSEIELTHNFFRECIETPVPIDLRAYKVLSEAPMAMDIYAWANWRASYVRRPTRPIPWQSLQAQFGSGLPFTEQGTRDFRKAFKRNLDLVRLVNPNLKVDESSNASGLILLPSSPHVKKLPGPPSQNTLF